MSVRYVFNPFTGNFDATSAGGGGAVDSVNGQTGTVVLDAADVGAIPGVSHTITSDTDVYPKSAPYELGANNEDILVLNATNYGIYIRLPFEGYPKQITVLMQEDQTTCFLAESDNGTNWATFASIAAQNDTGWTGTTPTGNTRIIPLDNRGTLVTFAADPNYGIAGPHAFGLIATSHAGLQQLGYGNSPDFTVGVISGTTISKNPKRWTLSQIEYARIGDAGLWWTWTAPVANAPDIATNHIPNGDFGLDSLGEVWVVSGGAWTDTGYNLNGGGTGVAKQAFSTTFVGEDTSRQVTVTNANITASSVVIGTVESEEAGILQMQVNVISKTTGSCDIIVTAPNGATGTYNGYISIM